MCEGSFDANKATAGCCQSHRHRLRFLSFLELYRTDVTERRMTARRVVEPLNLIEHTGAGLSRCSEQEIQSVARALNNRLRKTLGWKTPAETLNEYLKSVWQPGVATINPPCLPWWE